MSSGYITSGWNKLDFVVVVIGYVSLFASGAGGLKSLRTFRVLRPLKTISSVPSMRLIVVALIRAVPALGNVLALCAFIFFIFGIIGVNLWKGRMSGVCAFDASQDFSIIDRSQWESASRLRERTARDCARDLRFARAPTLIRSLLPSSSCRHSRGAHILGRRVRESDHYRDVDQ